VINCLNRLDLRAINLVTLHIKKYIESKIENVFLRRDLIQSFARFPNGCALVQELILGAL